MEDLINIWTLKMQNAKSESEKIIAEKRLQKLKAGMPKKEYNSQEESLQNVKDEIPEAEYPTNKDSLQVEIVSEDINELVTKCNHLKEIYEFTEDEETKKELDELLAKIDQIQIKQNPDAFKKYHSDVLNQDFTWNRQTGLITFEDGAIYKEEEVQMHNGITQEELFKLHYLKKNFKVEYIGNVPVRTETV